MNAGSMPTDVVFGVARPSRQSRATTQPSACLSSTAPCREHIWAGLSGEERNVSVMNIPPNIVGPHSWGRGNLDRLCFNLGGKPGAIPTGICSSAQGQETPVNIHIALGEKRRMCLALTMSPIGKEVLSFFFLCAARASR